MSTSTAHQSLRSKEFTLLLLGDLQLGRLIDALLPTSIARLSPHSDPEDAAGTIDKYILPRNPTLREYSYSSPWGNALELVRNGADVVLANLETALTVGEQKWEEKVFNYRSYAENVKVLMEGGFGLRNGRGRGYVSLANNHTLDWGVEGLEDTVRILEENAVAFAGAGRTKDEAEREGVLVLGGGEDSEREYEVRCWSFADHPVDWRAVEGFNFVGYGRESKELMRRQIMRHEQGVSKRRLGLKVVSMHWGPNYRWHPSKEITELAHWLIDECGVDVIHGHSSHHVQGVEVYKRKLIVYGCGDFVDDYAVDGKWRNDLSAAWRVIVGERGKGEHCGDECGEERGGLEVRKLEVFPNRIKLFQAGLLEREDEDHKWVERKFRELCEGFGTRVERKLGGEGQIVVDVLGQR